MRPAITAWPVPDPRQRILAGHSRGVLAVREGGEHVSAVAAERPGVTPDGPGRSLQLAIGGMTCASCAARIEKKLSKLDGVTATVNFATETARVSFPAGVSLDELITAVSRAGYTASLPQAPQADDAEPAERARPEGGSDQMAGLGRRLLASVALAVPVVVLAMVPAAQFRNWQWASLALASPVAGWGAWPFHRAAFASARHRAATMDTLISAGVGAAYL